MSTTSEWVVYRGRIIGEIDSTISVYGDNSGRHILKNGEVQVGANHPDSNGYFLIDGTTESHDDCDQPNHWESGPLEILVRGAGIRDTVIIYTTDQLRTLPSADLNSLDLSGYPKLLGAWQLPDIKISKVGDTTSIGASQ